MAQDVQEEGLGWIIVFRVYSRAALSKSQEIPTKSDYYQIQHSFSVTAQIFFIDPR